MSSLNISVESMKRVDLLRVAGRVDSNSAPDLDGNLKELTGNGRHNIVLELSQVDYMSSAGLRSLVSANKVCQRNGGDVRISSPSQRVAEVLDLAGLRDLFQVFPDTTKAVGSF